MEELSPDDRSKSSASTDNECNLSPVNSTDYKDYTRTSYADDRIECSNSKGLDMITQIVSSHVAQFASSLNLGEEETHFTSRVMEIFKDNIQENVTINGLPYVGDKNILTPSDKVVATNETMEALIANLSKKIQDVATKRKNFPKEYARICKMKLHHEYQNIKKATVTHSVRLPTVSKGSFKSDSLSMQKFQQTTERIKSAQSTLLDTVNELKELETNIKYARSIAAKQGSLSDTGYISS